MSQQPLPTQPPSTADFSSPIWQRWIQSLYARVSLPGQLLPSQISEVQTIGALSNLITSSLTILPDTTYIVVSYLKVQSNLTLQGNLGVFG